MTVTVLQRQWIRDAAGNPLGVILPIEEFALVKAMLEQSVQSPDETEKIAQMEQAARDPLFIADLQETMAAFAAVDAEWWEPVG